VFETVQADLLQTVMACSSGKELVGRGFEADVVEAARLDCSGAVARLVDGAYINQI
jgi:2-phosphosulfolactate phosphatase